MNYSLSFRRAPVSGGTRDLRQGVADAPGRGESRLTQGLLGKRAMDVAGSFFGVVWLSPLLLAIALLIRIDSPGPVLFRQRRMGLNGRPFTCLKFRTMVPDAEARLKEIEHLNESSGGVLFKIRRDPRLTRLGGFLRRSSLDELPQLFNVLAGQMSLVGPRPLQVRDCELLEEADASAYARRLAVRPGITGQWQVGGRSQTSFEHMIKLDVDYVENWSLWADLKILARTFEAVLSARGAC